MTDEQEGFTRLDESNLLRHRPKHFRARSAWWAHCFHLGRLVVLGPYLDQAEAQREAWEKLEGKGEVVELPTIDHTRARDMLKKKMLDRTRDLDSIMKRASYKGLKPKPDSV